MNRRSLLSLSHPSRTSRLRSGFTTLELVVVMGISSLVLMAVASFIISMFRTTRSINASLTAVEQGRRTVKMFTDELRTAAPSATGAYAIAEAGGTSITFYSDIDRDDYVERLRYFVDGTDLKRGYLKPSGDPLTYSEANETVYTVTQFLSNPGAVFAYFDDNYNGQTAPLTIPPNIPDIRLVRIRLLVDQYPTEPPGPYELLSEVSIRSLKDNL
jgi:type II secretory pathway pseudopilin PulG